MSDRRNETAPIGVSRQLSAASGRIGRGVMVGCFAMFVISMMCVAPVWVLGWWATSGDATTTLQHPGQVVGPIDAPITCPPGQWVMSWADGGQTHYACTPQW